MATKRTIIASLLLFWLLGLTQVCQGNTDEMQRLLEAGNKALAEARYPQALAAFQQGLELARQAKHQQAQMVLIGSIGIANNKLGQYGKALEYLQQALAIAREIKFRQGESGSLNTIGEIYESLGQYDKALPYYQQVLAIHRETEDRRQEGYTLNNLGIMYDNLGKYDQALSHYQQALAIHRLTKDRRNEGGDLNNIGIIYDKLGQYDQALSHYQQALAIHRETKDRRWEAGDLSNIGIVYDNLANYDQALSYYQQALTIHREIQDRMGEGHDLTNIGTVYSKFGNYDKALATYRQALSIHREIKSRKGEGADLAGIGGAYYRLGQYSKALAHYQEALAISQELKDRKDEGDNLLYIGVAYYILGQYDQARQVLNQSLPICQEVGAPESLWQAQRGLAKAEARWGQHALAIQHYEQALQTIESIRGGLQEKEARATFMQDKLFVYDELIELLRARHDQDPAQGYDRKSLEIFERKQGRQLLEEMGKSGARNFAGLPEEISKQEMELENRLDKLQANLVNERAKPEPSYPRIQALEGELQQAKAAFQTLKEQLRTQYPDYYALKYPQPAALSELQTQVLQPGEVILVYGVMQEKTCLWVIGKDKFVLYPLAGGEKELTEKVNRFRQGPDAVLQAIVHGQPAAKLQSLVDSAVAKVTPVEQELFDLLLPAAARQQIGSAQVLYIVPTGPLYSLPFEALRTQAGQAAPRYLIEDYAVAYLSSASLLQNLRQARLRKKEQAAYPLLAFANPDYAVDAAPAATRGTGIKTKSVEPKAASKVVSSFQGLRTRAYRQIMGGDFVSLPDTEVEVKEIKEILQAPEPTQPLQLRQAAARSQVLALNQSERLKNYRYLIFACHGILPGEVDRISQPALVLSDPDPGNQQEGYLTMADVFGLQFNADLVTLSACNSGGGKAQKGEGVIGLTRAFMYAGTQAVAVTQWSVESGAAKELNVGMFRYLSQNKDRAGALREIKLAMLRGRHGDLYRHPFFWAPLVIFGNGQ